MSYLKQCHNNVIMFDLVEKLNIKNINEIPSIQKSTLKISKKTRSISEPFSLLELISLQKPVLVRARKSLASFGLRQYTYHSVLVTLRRRFLFSFLLQYFFFAIPAIKGNIFSLLSRIDSRGCITVSVTDLNIFPFISEEYYKKFKHSYGMDVSFVINVSSVTNTKILLSAYQMLIK